MRRDTHLYSPAMSTGAANSAQAQAAKPKWREILASPKMVAIMVLGAASGFPNQIIESALQAWAKDSGVSLKDIGLLTYVATPYLVKFLWAPAIDRYPLPFHIRLHPSPLRSRRH